MVSCFSQRRLRRLRQGRLGDGAAWMNAASVGRPRRRRWRPRSWAAAGRTAWKRTRRGGGVGAAGTGEEPLRRTAAAAAAPESDAAAGEVADDCAS